jgi:MurNAc alpha-1-phosphate uridylyltransferase
MPSARNTMTNAPAGVILLAAGRGSRLSSLTEHTHKSLLPIAGKPAISYAIEAILARDVAEIVVVTGYMRDSIESFVRSRYAGRIQLAYNERYAADTNILSTEIGAAAPISVERMFVSAAYRSL